MAKKKKALVFLKSTEGTGYFYVYKTQGEREGKWEMRKYDPVRRKHVIFRETKMK